MGGVSLDIKITVGVMGILGIIVGALLQYFFTKFLEEKRHRRELRTQAYLDYMKCVSELAQRAQFPNKSSPAEIYARTADAKGRICLYGSPKVIRAFSIFEKLGATMGTADGEDSYIKMIKAMRKDSGNNCKIDSIDVALMLFGNQDPH